jgi:hypothetical protein
MINSVRCIFMFVALFVFSAQAGAAVISSLPMDGSNGSVSFLDGSGKTWTAFGNAQISTAQSISGGASALFDGSGDYIQADNSADFNFGSGPFSIDFWMRPLDVGANTYIAGRSYPDGGSGYDLRLDMNEVLVVGINGWGFNLGTYNVADKSYLTQDSWHHIILSSTGLNTYLLADGILQGTSPRSGISDGSNPFRIGLTSNFGGSGYNGYIDEFKMYDEAIWTPGQSVVPEPATMFLLGMGSLAMAVLKRKQKKLI